MDKKSFLVTYMLMSENKIVTIGNLNYTGYDLLTLNGIEYIKKAIRKKYEVSDNENVTILNIIELH